MSADTLTPASAEALFRYQVVSQVLGRILRGQVQADAVRQVAAHAHMTLDQQMRRISVRTIYRWLKAYRDGGLPALEPAVRTSKAASTVLDTALLDFLASEKQRDPVASVPELLKRARHHGLIAPDQRVDRTTAWRALKRMGVDTRRRNARRDRDARRFAYAHRMQMVLSDGKHFRAGVTRKKRVALFFLDDATRYGLHVVVGTSEHTALFLRGLYETVCRHGRMDALYLDNGPGFISLDTGEAVRRLGAAWILGTAGYPEGHGKIERFNRTAKQAVLRSLDGRPDVDPDCGALELRLQHYLRQVYNQDPHAALDEVPPQVAWDRDERPLDFPSDDAALRRCFVAFEERTVSADHVVKLDSIAYEVPRGHAGEKVILHRRLLDETLAMLHDGRLVQLHPVDLHANATDRRGRSAHESPTTAPPVPTAADLAHGDDLGPIVGPDGGFPKE